MSAIDISVWPELPYRAWKDTYATLHLWSQIVGKIRLAQTPWLNHSWHVTLYVSPVGMATSPIPYGDRTFELEFDFVRHVLLVSTDDGSLEKVGLFPRSVADFYADVMRTLSKLGIGVHIHEFPNEIPEPIRSARITTTHRTIQITPTHFGESCRTLTACSVNSAPPL